jgi:hypothetical protein
MMTDIKSIILNSIEGACLNKHDYLLNNIDFIAQHIKDIPGDIVECGVWKGATFSYMGTVFADRTMWAYDSFEGVPFEKEQIKYKDTYSVHGVDWSNCCPELVANESFLYESLEKYKVQNLDRINVVKGWFKDTLPNATQQIAVLRVDGDLYSSTYEVLEYLYPLVVKGGFVIFDDYCIDESRGAVHDYFSQLGELPTFYNPRDNPPTIVSNLSIRWDNTIDKYRHNLSDILHFQGTFVQK